MKDRIVKQLGFIGLGFAFVFFGYFVDMAVFPVIQNFSIASINKNGGDVVITGSLRKGKKCQLLQDVEAFTNDGKRLTIEFIDRGASKMTSRPAVEKADQPFGPWIVKGGEGKTFSLYSLHRCHALWTEETKLATISS